MHHKKFVRLMGFTVIPLFLLILFHVMAFVSIPQVWAHSLSQVKQTKALLTEPSLNSEAHSQVTPSIIISEAGQLTASDNFSESVFPADVAVSSNGNIVVTSKLCRDGGIVPCAGEVYVYERTGTNWESMTEIAKLSPSNPTGLHHFGRSVAVDGNTIVVGASGIRNSDTGQIEDALVYVFERPAEGWSSMTETAQLRASDGLTPFALYTPNQGILGHAVAIQGHTIVVSDPSDGSADGTYTKGALYVFNRPAAGWASATETAKLTTAIEAYNLGSVLAMNVDGTIIATGDTAHNSPVFVFNKPATGWVSMSETAILSVTNSEATISTLAINGVTIVAGDRGGQTFSGTVKEGTVYLFTRPQSGWQNMTETAQLTASDAADYDNFGNDVALQGNFVLVGAPGVGGSGNNMETSGAIYLFERPATGWYSMTENRKFTNTNGELGHLFGNRVVLHGNTLFVADPLLSENGVTDPGALHLFNFVSTSTESNPSTIYLPLINQ